MNHSLEQKISENIKHHSLLEGSECVVVALSGGADSVALLAMLTALGHDCVAAHCNFHLRGEESNRDEAHAMAIAQKLNAKFEVVHFDVATYEKENGVSTEMACRELRYKWFEQLRQKYNAQAIAVAHHRDDDIETMFLNLLRGSGIAGVAAMKWKNGHIVRPILDISRQEIEQYLKDKKIDFVVDSTNAEVEYKRNKLRNIVIPTLRENFPDADKMLAKSLKYLKDNNDIYQKTIKEIESECINGNEIDLTRLSSEFSQLSTLLHELLHKYGFNETHVDGIIKAINDSGRKFYSQQWLAFVNRGKLTIVPNCDEPNTEEYEVKLSQNIDFPISLQVEAIDVADFEAIRDNNVIYLDEKVLDESPRFVLRHWHEGDRISPFGMSGSKKLSNIFSDAKLSIAQKKKVWILERNGVILWVIGLRASRHFSKNSSTKRLLRLKLAEKS